MKFTKILALIMALCMVLSIGAMASGLPDTSQGGTATSRPSSFRTVRPVKNFFSSALCSFFIAYCSCTETTLTFPLSSAHSTTPIVRWEFFATSSTVVSPVDLACTLN